jgi:hypothetical protein
MTVVLTLFIGQYEVVGADGGGRGHELRRPHRSSSSATYGPDLGAVKG